ncbi:SDR family NAD(P)-dependent oxidoreductase [Antrihabitans sp. NCIMB 15449]|uniref:SDR family NAD(P)-dependent oxidoreductase n=1 Tax=Antrihabitans spumae TaxID=3373370 RepID=A0ABW7JTX6_9NOCA
MANDKAVEKCSVELRKYTGWSLMDELLATEDQSRMSETDVAQPANFALQVGLAELWRSWGIEPDAVLGHSTGEVAAQYLAGVLTLPEAVKVTYYRSSLQQRTSGSGRMLAVGMTPETLNQAVEDAGPLVSVAAVNSPSAVTLSGDATVLESMASQLESFGVFHRFLQVKVPYHSHYMDPIRDDLEAGLADLSPKSASIPLYSTVTGSRIDGKGANARYWWQNVRATVLFSAAFSHLLDDGYTHIVELSPHPVLASSMRELLAGPEQEGLVVPSLRRDQPDDEILLQSLGALHCHGHQVDWEVFYPTAESALVKLPRYPWQLKTYWNESAEAREDRHYLQVHPLLGQHMNAAHPTWELEVNAGHSLAYLADHRIQDNTLLPGAALIEMALAAAHNVYGPGHYSVDDLKLHKALILSPESDARLRTTLDQEQARVEIASYLALPGGKRQWTIHATAQLDLRPATAADRDVAAVQSQCDTRISREQFYELTNRLGFQYGPAFQAVREIATGDRLAVGRVEIPEEIATEVGEYLFHPSLIDAAFQVLLIASLALDSDSDRATPYLPVGVDRIRVLAPPVQDMVVVAEVVSADRTRILSNISLCDSAGRVLVEIDGFKAQSLVSAASLSLDRIDRGLYELEWQDTPRPVESEIAQPADDDQDAAAWVIFADTTGVGSEAARLLRAQGRRVFCVGHADVAKLVDGGNENFSINAADSSQYVDLVRILRQCQIANIVHLWSLDADFDESRSTGALEASQETGALSVTRLMQAVSAELSQVTKVWLVTQGAQAVVENSLPNVEQSPLWGLGRVIGHQEFTSLWGGLCDLDPDGSATDQARFLIDEIATNDREDQVAFRGNRRYIARLVQSGNLTTPFPARMREGGGYLVTGGLGALGLLVARFLVEKGARDVVLMGRSEIPARTSWDDLPADHPQLSVIRQVRELESLGSRIHFAAVDVTDADQLSGWMDTYREQGLPPISGVIHTAGVVDDELLVRMDAQTFQRVLRPKLVGGWLLHRLFRESDLDFFVLFSSTGAVIASPGQGNYAAGNAFLDALASYRRQQGLPGLSVGWGPWSVGMVEHLDLEQMYARRGIELITPESGMQALGRVLHQQPPHLVAITVDWAKARETSLAGQLAPMFAQLDVRDEETDDDGADAQALFVALSQTSGAERGEILGTHLRDMAARILGLDAADVTVEETLNSLGFDSMMAIEMKARIEAVLKVDVSVLDLLQGATIAGLANGLLTRLEFGGSATDSGTDEPMTGDATDVESHLDDLELLLADATPEELEKLLQDLETEQPSGPVAADEDMVSAIMTVSDAS